MLVVNTRVASNKWKSKGNAMDMKKEWKEIKGYEGKYIVSNYGEVISLPRLNQKNYQNI